LDEHELIQGLRQGEEPAFRWLVENYRNKVYHTVINIVQQEADAEDATQEVFIKVFESIDQFKQESTLSTWIYRIAVRKALDKLRRRKTRQKLQQLLPWWMPAEKKDEQPLFHHPGIELENKEKAAILFKAIDELPENQRIAFTLIVVQKMSYQEVVPILGKNIKALESLISRAKVKLQEKLEHIYRAKDNL
jgi:RNA polymerase sigma-70 factor (ECF subfamily)